ncbi:MAG TPA: AraC family transcriptional regulator [Anaerolineales bacterium]|nr:AraC family transcriptional regulator [Anaerolineales bacterium]
MDLMCEERLSDAPFVERIWRNQGEATGPFISIAEIEYALVVTKYRGKITITLRGPAIRATPAFCPPDAEFIGIQFKPGAFISNLPAKMVVDRHDINLPEATGNSFWLNGSAWQYPSYENADTFVNRLVREELLVHEPVVETVLQGQAVDMSLRTVQRRFLGATGLTNNTIYQINRAQYATTLLKQGVAILDTVHQAGYFDQPHLTRSLKQFIGLTPAQITDPERTERLSFLYKKNPPWLRYNTNTPTIDIYSSALSASF